MPVELCQPAPGEALRLVAVHAHPDDESSKGAAAMARYASEGVEVTVITCTGGERGDILNPALKDDPGILEDLPAVRRREMAAAQEILGVGHEWLGFIDSGLPEGDPVPELPEGSFATLPVEEAARPLVATIRRLRPHVIITYDENGGYPHPDHIQTHRIAMHAFDRSGEEGFAPELGEPWTVAKIYYTNVMSRQKLQGVLEYLRGHGMSAEQLETMLAWMERMGDRLITTRVDVHDFLEVRDAALRAHATQVDPDGPFFAISNDVLREAWPTDDFELRCSRVGVTLPERDLFAGLRADEEHA